MAHFDALPDAVMLGEVLGDEPPGEACRPPNHDVVGAGLLAPSLRWMSRREARSVQRVRQALRAARFPRREARQTTPKRFAEWHSLPQATSLPSDRKAETVAQACMMLAFGVAPRHFVLELRMPSPTETKMLPRPVLARLVRVTSAIAIAFAAVTSAPASRADGVVPRPPPRNPREAVARRRPCNLPCARFPNPPRRGDRHERRGR